MSRNEIERDFENIHATLRELEKRYNPENNNLGAYTSEELTKSEGISSNS